MPIKLGTLSREDLAASFQAAVVDVLVHKTQKALTEYPVKQLVIAGGVAANQGLKEAMNETLAVHFPDVDVIVPPLRLTGDNGAMIGLQLILNWQNGISLLKI